MSKTQLIALVFVAFFAGSVIAVPASRKLNFVAPDTVYVEDEQISEMLQEKSLEVEGLKARLLAVENLEPEIVYVSRDTTPPPEGVCIEAVGGRPMETAFVSEVVLNPTMPDSIKTYARKLSDGFEIFKCQRFYIDANGFACDMPRLGILDAFADIGVRVDQDDPFVIRPGLSWRRWASSRWSVNAAWNPADNSYELWGTVMFNLFGR